jgi:hypothetical protein
MMTRKLVWGNYGSRCVQRDFCELYNRTRRDQSIPDHNLASRRGPPGQLSAATGSWTPDFKEEGCPSTFFGAASSHPEPFVQCLHERGILYVRKRSLEPKSPFLVLPWLCLLRTDIQTPQFRAWRRWGMTCKLRELQKTLMLIADNKTQNPPSLWEHSNSDARERDICPAKDARLIFTLIQRSNIAGHQQVSYPSFLPVRTPRSRPWPNRLGTETPPALTTPN